MRLSEDLQCEIACECKHEVSIPISRSNRIDFESTSKASPKSTKDRIDLKVARTVCALN